MIVDAVVIFYSGPGTPSSPDGDFAASVRPGVIIQTHRRRSVTLPTPSPEFPVVYSKLPTRRAASRGVDMGESQAQFCAVGHRRPNGFRGFMTAQVPEAEAQLSQRPIAGSRSSPRILDSLDCASLLILL